MRSVQAPTALCLLRLAVRTPPFHGGNRGSIPLGDANIKNTPFSGCFFCFTDKYIKNINDALAINYIDLKAYLL